MMLSYGIVVWTNHSWKWRSKYEMGEEIKLICHYGLSSVGKCKQVGMPIFWISFIPLVGMVPLLSLDALQKLDTFIFVLAIVHVVLCLMTMFLGEAKIHQWKDWEDSIQMQKHDTVLKSKVTHIHQHAFIREHFLGTGRVSNILKWLHSFIKQFYESMTKSDYITLRLGFIHTHCRGNTKFNFYQYMLRTLEADFMQVAGIGLACLFLDIFHSLGPTACIGD